MKKSLFFFSLAALSLAVLPTVQAQMFQNSNTDCEEIPIIFLNSGMSVACKYYNANSDGFPYSGADFDGNAYPDCVIGANVPGIGPSTTSLQASVLINVGAGGTCGSQFNSAENYNVSGLVTLASTNNLASTVAGPIAHPYNASLVPTSDFAIPLLGTSRTTDPIATAPNAGTGFGVSPGPISTNDVPWALNLGDNASPVGEFDKTLALLDCNADGDLDAVMAVGAGTADFFGVNILINNGSALQATSSQALTDVAYTSGNSVLAVGDFNNDGTIDVVMAMEDGGSSFVEICTNDGSCGFTCQPSSRVDLDVELGATPISPTSVAAGDFNGDGNVDAVITTPGLPNTTGAIAFLFGNGAAGFSSSRLVPYSPNVGTAKVLATGCFDNDNNPDVAVTEGLQTEVTVGVFTGVTASTQTTTSLTFNETVALPWGIDTADFDGQGGDDIMMVANDVANTANPRQAFVFLNTVESIVANAGSDVTSSADVVQLTGTCATNPADSTAEFATTWTILSPASGATLTNATTLTPTLTATVPGTYVVQLTCRTRCKDTATDTVSVTIGNSSLCLEGSGAFTGSPSNNCGAGCSLGMAPFSWVGILSFFSGIGVLWSVRRRLK